MINTVNIIFSNRTAQQIADLIPEKFKFCADGKGHAMKYHEEWNEGMQLWRAYNKCTLCGEEQYTPFDGCESSKDKIHVVNSNLSFSTKFPGVCCLSHECEICKRAMSFPVQTEQELCRNIEILFPNIKCTVTKESEKTKDI